MKITTTLFFTLFCSLNIFAQSRKLIPKHESFVFYNIAYIAFANAPSGTEQGLWSVEGDFGAMLESSWSERGGLGYGLSYSFQNFSNNHLVSTNSNNGNGNYQVASDTSFDRSYQSFQYLYLPLELRFRGKKNKNNKFFRFYIGARGGLRTTGYSDIRRANSRTRFYKLKDLARFRADAYLKIGYGNTSLFAFYSLSPLYEAGEIFKQDGTGAGSLKSIRPVGIGLSFML
jgi:hypothetical protein